MSTTITPKMGLPNPVPGDESGPQWAQDLYDCINKIDTHTHVLGAGALITPSAININASLPFAGNSLTLVGGITFSSNSIQPNQSLYFQGSDFYLVDGSGNNIRLTQGGSIAGATGSITGLTSPASASYSGGTFTWQSNVNTPANMDAASYIFRNNVASSKGLTLSPPNSMAADYTITLPVLPANARAVSIDNSGTLATGVSGFIKTADIASQQITTATIADLNVTAAKIANSTITGAQVSSNINLPGKAVQSASQNVVVSNTNAGQGLAIIRGGVNSAGAITIGEGFTVAIDSGVVNAYIITFTTPFIDAPAVAVTAFSPLAGTPGGNVGSFATIYGINLTTFRVATYFGTGSGATPTDFTFIAAGQRA